MRRHALKSGRRHVRRVRIARRGAAACLALTAAASLLAALPAAAPAARNCPQAALRPQPKPRRLDQPPARAVLACVGKRAVTGKQLAHWAGFYEGLGIGRTLAVRASMRLVISRQATAAEAHARGIVVTARDVDRYERRHRRAVHAARALGLTAADVRIQVRHDLLVAALRRAGLKGDPEAVDVWRSRTACARAYADRDLCGRFAPVRDASPHSA
jgi:hypothetical protein